MPIDRVRFVTLAGNIEMNITAETFDLAREMTSIRSCGYAMGPTYYLPVSSILAVVTYDSVAVAEGRETVDISVPDRGQMN